MIDPKTYNKAMRAARNVARSSARAAVGLGLLTGASACDSASEGAASADQGVDVAGDAAISGDGGIKTADVLDSELMETAGGDLSDGGPAEDLGVTDDGIPLQDAGPAKDLETGPVDAGAMDTAVADDAVDAGSDIVADAPATDVLVEVMEEMDTSTDVGSSCSCLMPTEYACTGWEELVGSKCETDAECAENSWDGADVICNDSGVCAMGLCDLSDKELFGLVCSDGLCHEGEGWGPCCEAAMVNEDCNMGIVPGCTPWGPPAPSAYDGLTLADFGLA